jgi:hypothetical protein
MQDPKSKRWSKKPGRRLVFWNRRYTASGIDQDSDLKSDLKVSRRSRSRASMPTFCTSPGPWKPIRRALPRLHAVFARCPRTKARLPNPRSAPKSMDRLERFEVESLAIDDLACCRPSPIGLVACVTPGSRASRAHEPISGNLSWMRNSPATAMIATRRRKEATTGCRRICGLARSLRGSLARCRNRRCAARGSCSSFIRSCCGASSPTTCSSTIRISASGELPVKVRRLPVD